MKTLFITLCLLVSVASYSQSSKQYFTINIPTIEQEASSIWRTINDISFFEKQSYSINLPKHQLIDELIKKSKEGNFGNDDYSIIYNLLETKVYNKKNYEAAFNNVKNQENLINNIIGTLQSQKDSWNWDFKFFEEYKIVFTLYGSGGSYNPENAVITLYTTEQGGFKNYKNPANTIIHEIVHIGIEQSIVKKHQLSHGLKERVVDSIVYLLYSNVLPNYKIQEMGDRRLDNYLKKTNDIKKLEDILIELKQ